MSVEDKIKASGLELPEPFAFPNPNRVGCVRVGNLLYVSGHPPAKQRGIMTEGKVEADVPEADAVFTAQACALNMLASIKKEIGSLERIKRVVKINGMVNSSPGFIRQFAVIDGASDLFVTLFGLENGRHARSAVGMAELPRNIPVEVEGVFELKE